MAKAYMGGSFAPPLTDELLANYQAMAASLDPKSQLAEAFATCLHCCGQWWELPESKGEGKPHITGKATAIDLDADVAAKLWDHIPWPEEIDVMAGLFEQLDPVEQRDLRNSAHHLLWHVKELNLDREPCTSDKL